jgi:hypothetical protein
VFTKDNPTQKDKTKFRKIIAAPEGDDLDLNMAHILPDNSGYICVSYVYVLVSSVYMTCVCVCVFPNILFVYTLCVSMNIYMFVCVLCVSTRMCVGHDIPEVQVPDEDHDPGYMTLCVV